LPGLWPTAGWTVPARAGGEFGAVRSIVATVGAIAAVDADRLPCSRSWVTDAVRAVVTPGVATAAAAADFDTCDKWGTRRHGKRNAAY